MKVDVSGQTVSATRFADLTGVSRDRLRAWERRYGFPEPVRSDGGPRRYLLGDVARVVAVRRASEAGRPIPAAIRATTEPAPEIPAAATIAAVLEDAPFPAALVSGPEPLRLVWGNAAMRRLERAPSPGDELPEELADSRLGAELRRQFTHELPRIECAHPAWTRGGWPARSAVYRVAGPQPLVALVGMQSSTDSDAREVLAATEAELEAVRARTARYERWLDAQAGMAQAFQHEPGPGVVGVALDVLVRHTGAVDAAYATAGGGRLTVGESRRGLLAERELVVAGHPGLARAIRDREGVWLDLAAAHALGVPDGLAASAIPVVIVGELLGLVVCVFEHVEPHDADNRRLLASVSAAIGFAALRDRLVHELHRAGAQRPGRFVRS